MSRSTSSGRSITARSALLDFEHRMMYWIVFALYCFAESIADIIISFWFPFYYELKVIFVLWLLSPWTRGASILYKKVGLNN